MIVKYLIPLTSSGIRYNTMCCGLVQHVCCGLVQHVCCGLIQHVCCGAIIEHYWSDISSAICQ